MTTDNDSAVANPPTTAAVLCERANFLEPSFKDYFNAKDRRRIAAKMAHEVAQHFGILPQNKRNTSFGLSSFLSSDPPFTLETRCNLSSCSLPMCQVSRVVSVTHCGICIMSLCDCVPVCVCVCVVQFLIKRYSLCLGLFFFLFQATRGVRYRWTVGVRVGAHFNDRVCLFVYVVMRV